MNKKLRDFKPDVIHAHCELPELLLSLSRPRKNVILRATQHGYKIWNGKIKILGIIVRTILTLKNVEWYVPSQGNKIWLSNKSPKILPNPIEIPLENEFWIGNCGYKKILGFVGRLHKEKRPDIALNLAISCEANEIKFFGTGYLQSKLKSSAIKVSLNGFSEKRWLELRNINMLLVTSLYEADGLVLAEAIARGFPILAIDFPGLQKFPLGKMSVADDYEGAKNTLLKFFAGQLQSQDFINLNGREIILNERNPIKIAELYSSNELPASWPLNG